MRFILLPALLLLAACATPQQLAQQRQWELNADAQACANYGLIPGTEGFAQCRMQLDLARQQQYNYNSSPQVGIGVGYYGGHHHRRHGRW